MAIQTFKSWGLALLGEFIKAGSTAAHAALAAAVVVDGMDIWARTHEMIKFAAAAFIIKGVTGALEYLAKDPVPGDEDAVKP